MAFFHRFSRWLAAVLDNAAFAIVALLAVLAAAYVALASEPADMDALVFRIDAASDAGGLAPVKPGPS